MACANPAIFAITEVIPVSDRIMISDQKKILLTAKDPRLLSRYISLVENKGKGYEDILENLPSVSPTHIVGLTGPPGAGKSTLVDALVNKLLQRGKKIAILAIDPSSPFHHGALLGDRIRMSRHYNHPDVFIRSLATRGSLGGLHPEIIGISTLIGAAGFDYLLIETVGVGQSEVEIAALANTTVVILVPESGDEIQTMKAGLMEIADIFVVNKSDHVQADEFARNLRILVHQKKSSDWEIPVIKTIAVTEEGVEELLGKIILHQATVEKSSERQVHQIAKKAYQLIQSNRMKDIDIQTLETTIKQEIEKGEFNLYRFIKRF